MALELSTVDIKEVIYANEENFIQMVYDFFGGKTKLDQTCNYYEEVGEVTFDEAQYALMEWMEG